MVGVTAIGPCGIHDFRGSHVVIASGGCAANPRLFEDLHGVPLYAKTAYPTSQGDGLILGMSAGGAIVGGEKYASLPGLVPGAWQYPAQMYAWAPLHPMVRQPWEILVNAQGERFVREDHPSVHQIERGIYRQPGHRHWAIFDADMLAKSEPIIPDWSRERLANEYQTHPMFSRAMTLEELAFRAGINAASLRQNIDDCNRRRQTAQADRFGRTHRPAPIATPPAYTNGMLVTPAITFGRLLGSALAGRS